MKSCSKCNCTFTFIDRLKSTLDGELECKKYNSIYKVRGSIYRAVYFFIIMSSNTGYAMILNYLGYEVFNLKLLVQILILIFLIIAYDLIPHKFQRYTKIK